MLAAVAAAIVASQTFAGSAASAAGTRAAAPRGFLAKSHIMLRSAKNVNLTNQTVRLPLQRGTYKGKTVWYVITESSDFGLSRDLNVNFAPKLANMAIGCALCVQTVSETAPAGNKFGEGIVNFDGIPDFKPTRVLKPGSTGGAPPAKVQPGAVGDAKYSPFIRINGSPVVYNAPIVAVGKGPFDVVRHTNTADRVLAINLGRKAPPGRFNQPTVDILMVQGFDAGHRIFYISTESSDPLAATLERATFVPLLSSSALLGVDDALGSARERIFIFANGRHGKGPQAQGIDHLIRDGHAAENASLQNRGLIDALRNGGDLLNTLGDFPSLGDPRHANAYSPLWDAQLGQWSKKAIASGKDLRQVDENEIVNLAALHPELLTGPKGAPYGSVGFVINCPIIGFLTEKPTKDRVDIVKGGQG